MSSEGSVAFAPGRVNLIGEHTDYNLGLALPFAIAEGVTVRAKALGPGPTGEARVSAYAADLDERDEFLLRDVPPGEGWRAFVRGTVAELQRAGFPLVGSSLEIGGGLPQGSGLSSSAALEVALALALIDLGSPGAFGLDRMEIARLCSRVENDWVGAQTGLLDQIASLYGAADATLCIDFRVLDVKPVPLHLKGWHLVLLHSGERHANASSGYNQRRAECSHACRLLGVSSLREADSAAVARLPVPERLRAQHILGENERVLEAVDALQREDLPRLGELLNASHESLRDLFQISTPAVEAAVQSLLRAGASGARLMGGGFGGSVLGLFAPDVSPPPGVRDVRPSAGAHVLGE